MRVSTSQRLKQIMSERNLKQVDILQRSIPLQNELGIKMGKSTLSQYVTGKQSPDDQRYYLLSKLFNVSEPWLMGFDVPRERIPDKERGTIKPNITSIYNKLDNKRRMEVYNYAEKLLSEQNGIADLDKHRQNKKIVNGRSTAAGFPIDGDAEDKEASIMIIDQTEIPNDADEIVTIAGNSMEPDYPQGSQVFIHYQPEVENGEVAIVSIVDEGVTCKKVYYDFDEKKIILESINEDYDDMVYSMNEVRVIGKVL